jgi:hypothetical protein
MSDDGRTYWERHAKNYDRSMALLGGPLAAPPSTETLPLAEQEREAGIRLRW